MSDIFDQVSQEDAALLRRDLMLYGKCYVKDGKRVSPQDVILAPPVIPETLKMRGCR